MNNKITIRECTENDCALLIEFIKQLAKYENMLDQVTVTIKILRKQLLQNMTVRLAGMLYIFIIFLHGMENLVYILKIYLLYLNTAV